MLSSILKTGGVNDSSILFVADKKFLVSLFFCQPHHRSFSTVYYTSLRLISSLEHHSRGMVGEKLSLSRKTLGPFRHALRELEVIIRQKVHHDHLDFIAGKEPSEASVPAVSECHAVEIAGRILQVCGVGIFQRPESGESEPIESLRIRVHLRVHGNGLGWNTDGRSGRDEVIIRQRIVSCDNPFESNCKPLAERSEFTS